MHIPWQLMEDNAKGEGEQERHLPTRVGPTSHASILVEARF